MTRQEQSRLNTKLTRGCMELVYTDALALAKIQRYKSMKRNDIRNASSYTKSKGCYGKKFYFVEINLKQFVRIPKHIGEFSWAGVAFDAYEARAKAWTSWLRQAEEAGACVTEIREEVIS